MKHLAKPLFALCLVLFAALARAGAYDDFFMAVRQDDTRTVQALLQKGFDPNTRDPKGLHGLHLALQQSALKVARVLAEWPRTHVEARTVQDESPLMLAALQGQLALARLLVDKGADVNKPGWAPLHYAATNGHLELMQLLLDESAYVDAESPNGTTPLMMAAHYGTVQAVRLLLDAGADPLLKNQLGLTAMDFAHRANRADVADMIAAAVRARQPRGKW